MPRTWSRRELEPGPATEAEAARSSRYAARLLVAALSLATATTLVVTSTRAAVPEPRDVPVAPPHASSAPRR